MLYIDLYNVDLKPTYDDVMYMTQQEFQTYLNAHKLNDEVITIDKYLNENLQVITLKSLYENANYLSIRDTNSNYEMKYYFITSSNNATTTSSYYYLQLDVWHTYARNNININKSLLSMLSIPRHNEINLFNTSNIGVSSGVYSSKTKATSIISAKNAGTIVFITKSDTGAAIYYAYINYQNILQFVYWFANSTKLELTTTSTTRLNIPQILKCYFVPSINLNIDIEAQYNQLDIYSYHLKYGANDEQYAYYEDASGTLQNIVLKNVNISNRRNENLIASYDYPFTIDNKSKWKIGTLTNQIELPQTIDNFTCNLKIESDLILDFKILLEVNKENIVDLTSDFEITFYNDAFNQWYNQNQGVLNAQNANNKIQIASSILMAAAGVALSGLTGGASLLSTIGGIAGATTSGITFTNQQNAAIEAAKKQPAIVSSFFATGYLSIYESGISLFKYTPTNITMLDALENAYGVKTTTYINNNQLHQMLNKSNYNFIYVKFDNVKLSCDGTKQNQLIAITNILKKGVRIWLTASNFEDETTTYYI